MKLKGIEMQGFKSFADKTKLTFEDGLTAIVGPNGSGKSNVSDAIKWVFGEQSVKSLRGSKMEDVIFSGTQARKSHGYCTVSLIIDNTSKAVDIDENELIISRKLYRTGDSEYRINGNSVRLKDINELFMDTGLGRDGYSIIEQGKIADIVNAKSFQRREIFEEAAGISKYRYKKAEAIRQLEAARENLLRLMDILLELENRLIPLKAQAEKAELFISLSNEKKELELSLWIFELDVISKKLRELEDKILILSAEKENLNASANATEKKLEECEQFSQQLSVYLERCRLEISNYNAEISDTQSKISQISSDIAYKKATADGLRQRLSDFGTDREEIKAEIFSLTEKISKFKLKNEDISRQIQDYLTEFHVVDKDIHKLEDNIDTLKSSIEKLNFAKAKLLSEKHTNFALAESSKERLSELLEISENSELKMLVTEKETLSKHLLRLEEKLLELVNTSSGYEYKISVKSEILADLDDKIFALEKKSAEKLQRSQVLSDLEKSMDGYSGSIKYVLGMSNSLGGLYGTVGSLITVEKEYVLAIEIALGAAIGNLVVEDEQSAKRYISALKKSGAGRATFLPVSTIKAKPMSDSQFASKNGFVAVASALVCVDEKFRGVMDWLLGRTIISENLDSAVELGRICENKYKIVTLDGQVVNAGGSLTGGSVGKSGSMLSRKSEIEQLNFDVAELLRQVKELETKRSGVNLEVLQLKAEHDGVFSEIQTLREDISATKAQQNSVSTAIENAEHRAERVSEQIQLLKQKISEFETGEQDFESSIASLQKEENTLNQTLLNLQEQYTNLNKKHSTFEEKIKEFELSKLLTENDIQSVYKEIAALQDKADLNLQKKSQFENDIDTLLNQVKVLTEELNLSESLILQKRTAIEDVQKEIDIKKTDVLSNEKEISTLRSQLKQITSQIDIVSMELGKQQERKNSAFAESEEVAGRLFEEYELTISEAKKQAAILENRDVAQRRLTVIRQKLREMGSVNTEAVDEYRSVKQRYDFMKAQTDDAQNAKDNLLKLIENLSTDMSRIFLDNFGKISSSFSSIFTELFGGGSASLLLEDEKNPLECNIEIAVQPPGKLIKNLSALSGGEQAMVAICIYFAILSISPSPFVLIDEIDAALDDVNVARFAQYLSKLTNNTQFIAITHRRGTMERANVLYGVTMEEKGISKLLKLNIGELEDKLNISVC